ncbi:MAG: S8 family serine peptidase, partial [Candidatus Margulisbacteria bacterium]|nr:S8 family serine peptidase [Candidatus Margulisiibacteriota bacterium]
MLRKYFLILILLLSAAGAVTPVQPDDTHYNQQDYLRQISANYAWALSTGNANTVKIAVLDSGVDSGHEDLNVLSGWNFVSNPSDNNSEPNPASSQISYHGTAVAGIAAAIGNNGKGTAGIAWNAEILPVRVI